VYADASLLAYDHHYKNFCDLLIETEFVGNFHLSCCNDLFSGYPSRSICVTKSCPPLQLAAGAQCVKPCASQQQYIGTFAASLCFHAWVLVGDVPDFGSAR